MVSLQLAPSQCSLLLNFNSPPLLPMVSTPGVFGGWAGAVSLR